MAILDIFKRKIKEPKKEEKIVIKKEPVKKASEDRRQASASNSFRLRALAKSYDILRAPHTTEKAMNLGAENKYVFKVKGAANKTEVKKAIQSLYGVRVEGINIINIPRKRRRLGRSEGFKSGCKKAIVKLKQGEKIDLGA